MYICIYMSLVHSKIGKTLFNLHLIPEFTFGQTCCFIFAVSSLVTEDKSDLSGSSSFYSQRPRFKVMMY